MPENAKNYTISYECLPKSIKVVTSGIAPTTVIPNANYIIKILGDTYATATTYTPSIPTSCYYACYNSACPVEYTPRDCDTHSNCHY